MGRDLLGAVGRMVLEVQGNGAADVGGSNRGPVCALDGGGGCPKLPSGRDTSPGRIEGDIRPPVALPPGTVVVVARRHRNDARVPGRAAARGVCRRGG